MLFSPCATVSYGVSPSPLIAPPSPSTSVVILYSIFLNSTTTCLSSVTSLNLSSVYSCFTSSGNFCSSSFIVIFAISYPSSGVITISFTLSPLCNTSSYGSSFCPLIEPPSPFTSVVILWLFNVFVITFPSTLFSYPISSSLFTSVSSTMYSISCPFSSYFAKSSNVYTFSSSSVTSTVFDCTTVSHFLLVLLFVMVLSHFDYYCLPISLLPLYLSSHLVL